MHLNKLLYFRQNWKLCLHLVLRTKHFGVNNQLWSTFPSMWGWSWPKILWALTIRPIISNYKQMKFRARIGFVSKDTLTRLGWERKQNKKGDFQ